MPVSEMAAGSQRTSGPGFDLKVAADELRKWNFPAEVTERYLVGLRSAGVPGGPSERTPSS